MQHLFRKSQQAQAQAENAVLPWDGTTGGKGNKSWRADAVVRLPTMLCGMVWGKAHGVPGMQFHGHTSSATQVQVVPKRRPTERSSLFPLTIFGMNEPPRKESCFSEKIHELPHQQRGARMGNTFPLFVRREVLSNNCPINARLVSELTHPHDTTSNWFGSFSAVGSW